MQRGRAAARLTVWRPRLFLEEEVRLGLQPFPPHIFPPCLPMSFKAQPGQIPLGQHSV